MGKAVAEGSSATKKVFFWFLALLPLAFLLEIASYVVIQNYIPSRIRARQGRGTIAYHIAQRPRAKLYQPHFIKKPAAPAGSLQPDESSSLLMFHPVLGWDYPPGVIYRDIDGITYSHGPGGERITCTSFPTTLVAAYGDSFTYGTDVRDDETWETYLGKLLRTNVLNFGVAGYGTDQAYLKYKESPGVRTPVVMLCIWPENINRVVNVYRPFLYHKERLGLTKPMFKAEGKGFRLIPNPLKKASGVKKLDDPAYLGRIAQDDYWFQLDKRLPPIRFPYTLAMIRWRKPIFEQLVLSTSRLMPGPHHFKYPWNLFDESGPLRVMCHIIDLFETTARSRGAVPIVVIFPHKDQVREILDFHRSRAEPLVDYMKRKGYPFIDLLQLVADLKPSPDQLEKWFQGHSTGEGNRILARILASKLRRLCPGVFPRTSGSAKADNR